LLNHWQKYTFNPRYFLWFFHITHHDNTLCWLGKSCSHSSRKLSFVCCNLQGRCFCPQFFSCCADCCMFMEHFVVGDCGWSVTLLSMESLCVVSMLLLLTRNLSCWACKLNNVFKNWVFSLCLPFYTNWFWTFSVEWPMSLLLHLRAFQLCLRVHPAFGKMHKGIITLDMRLICTLLNFSDDCH
jgi:hypothetical protein